MSLPLEEGDQFGSQNNQEGLVTTYDTNKKVAALCGRRIQEGREKNKKAGVVVRSQSVSRPFARWKRER
jgi:hypothetical protein